MLQRRCLIPASNYYEWEKRDGKKIKYAIRPTKTDMLYLAGIYHLENHDGIIIPTFTVLTREAAPEIAFIHHRMPVILPSDYATDWLNTQNNADEVIHAALTEMEYQPA